jgi:hypothetical protein
MVYTEQLLGPPGRDQLDLVDELLTFVVPTRSSPTGSA